ncbi:unnamed protein product [Alopecurus aequalis]
MAVAVKVGPWGAPAGGQPVDIPIGSKPQTLGNTDPEHTIKKNIKLGPGEYLYDLSGSVNDNHLLSLRLVTNQHEYMVGTPLKDTAFSVPLENGKVVAFFGRSDNDQVAIGVYVTPKP